MALTYPWLTPLADSWKQVLSNNRMTGALLLESSKGLGVEQLVEHFTQALACNSSDGEACGFCHNCELAKAKVHPDIHWMQPEKVGKAITVDQIRQCNRWAQESSQLGGKRLIIISPAEAMNESASNALLKTLEEPAQDCIFLLVTQNKPALLATIVSRCQCWRVEVPSTQECLSWLKTQDLHKVSDDAIVLNHGAPLEVFEFYQSGKDKQYQQLIAAIQRYLESPLADPAPVWKLLKESTLEQLQWLSYLLLKLQKHHFGLVDAELQGLASSLSYNSAYQAMVSLNELVAQLTQFPGLNQELLVHDWLFKLHGKKDVC
ncbi:DNA polymerase III subunit delta' [Vibrio sp. SCSIO 43136]|uniref:DNA polymerase III subunit delta' n=1 Tax=Vibrio sp. SCSIO 43136 TaxID=2819101 RepID=UPI00207552B1|nr:DNA polymerase III subunit delta' [Vibrio sp. SCSIO 43136]USD64405.1 DNA polymerase III subunit delta' [Vibrio sp. SCSIO 43136]